jgi:putative ABC transport system substrate-binding protein
MTETSSFPFYRVFFHELRRSGYIEGRNLIVERYSVERPTVELAREVLRSKPDVIFSLGPWTAFLKTLTTIPIVAFLGDPVGHGLVVSLAHPGGNMTGVSVDAGPEVGLDVGKGLLEQIGPVTREEFLRGAAARGG